VTNIIYDTPADVHLRLAGGGAAMGGAAVWNGTLAGAVRYVMAMSEDERSRASIATDRKAGIGRTWLEFTQIEALFLRPDFPLED
jgi:hypothetical protein